MKKCIIITLAALFFLTSCGSTKYLTGNYQNSYSTITDKSYDDVWDNVIDFFAEKGIPIATLEKNSGLIVASQVKCTATIEKDGKPFNPSAYVVIPNHGMSWVRNKPKENNLFAVGTFNVRVKTVKDKTQITVNFYDIEVYEHQVTMLISGNIRMEGAASTGVFEKSLLEIFNE